MSTRPPSGFAIVTLKSLALSPLVDDEATFENSFPDPVVLLPIPTADADDEDETPRQRPTRIPGTQRFKPMIETVADDGTALHIAKPIEAYSEAVIIALQASGTTIGRASTNDVPIPTGTVSGRHGQFSRSPNGKWAYTDVGSTNGSLVRGKPVPRNKPVELDNGAEITLGTDVSVLFLTPAGLLNLSRLIRAKGRPDAG